MEDHFTIIEHLRMLLANETEAKKKAEKQLEKHKNAFLSIEKKYYPQDVKFLQKAKMIRIKKEDLLEETWASYTQELSIDPKADSFCVCCIGKITEYDS